MFVVTAPSQPVCTMPANPAERDDSMQTTTFINRTGTPVIVAA